MPNYKPIRSRVCTFAKILVLGLLVLVLTSVYLYVMLDHRDIDLDFMSEEQNEPKNDVTITNPPDPDSNEIMR